MQSSTAIAIRALIMLIVLISVPLFAIFGKNLPDVVKGLLEGRGLVLGPAPETAANGTPAAPLPAANNPFAQPAAYRASPETASTPAGVASPPNSAPLNAGSPSSTLTASGALPPSSAAPGNFAMNGMSGPGAGSNLMSPPATVATPPVAIAPANDWRLPPTANALSPSSAPQPSAAPPASFQSPPEAAALTPSDAAPHDSFSAAPPIESPYANKAASATGATAVPSTTVSDEKFRQAETRLRELGATHYMLETWGPDNNRYHFVCKMAIGGNADVSRVFQAFGEDPWQAMETVLRQVEDWRARPQPQ